jgi:hypothetical protein
MISHQQHNQACKKAIEFFGKGGIVLRDDEKKILKLPISV